MRDLNELNRFRLDAKSALGWNGDATCGMFELFSPVDLKDLRVIASSEGGWDHVSVSRADRCPSWEEMEHVKRKFFKDDEVAMQLHVPTKEHVNCHPNCLHLWRPNTPSEGVIPRPPAWMVGPSSDVKKSNIKK